MITSASLVNLAPVLNVALMGFIVALGPLCWVWLKTRRNHMLYLPDQQALGTARTADEGLQQLRSRQRLLLLSQITLFLTFDLLIFGAFTRLTDSGLGCPDWPGCYGHASPSGADAMIQGAQALMPTGPVTHLKAWIEMIHRYLATGVGVLILTIALFTVSQKYPKQLKVESLIILLWVCVQGAFGAFTVTMRLFPAVVTMHLLGAIVLLILLTRYAMAQRAWVDSTLSGLKDVVDHVHRQSSTDSGYPKHLDKAAQALSKVSQSSANVDTHPYFYPLLLTGVILVIMQIALGGWVSTNYAVTACTSFPMCQNSWWPLMNFAQGFEIWRPLGLTSMGSNIDFEALTAIHYTHRLTAYVVFGFVCALGFVLRRDEKYKTLGQLLWLLIALQVLTGISNVIFQWPLIAAVMHTGGAAALGIVLTVGLMMAKSSPANPNPNPTQGHKVGEVDSQSIDLPKGSL